MTNDPNTDATGADKQAKRPRGRPRKPKPTPAEVVEARQTVMRTELVEILDTSTTKLRRRLDKLGVNPISEDGHPEYMIKAVEEKIPGLDIRASLLAMLKRELVKSGDAKPAAKRTLLDVEFTEKEIASAKADGGHARFIERIFNDLPDSPEYNHEEREASEMMRFEYAQKRLAKLEQLTVTSEEDGDLVAAQDAYAQFVDLFDRIDKRWPRNKKNEYLYNALPPQPYAVPASPPDDEK